MAAQTLDQALRVAAIMRQLREVEMGDARECRGDLETALEHRLPPLACERYRERVRRHVQAARKWNRQLVIAERAVRQALYRRQYCRPLPSERRGDTIAFALARWRA